ncbi:MAG TPA: PRC-barrel domain-containing protein [Longimicrobium sp.]|nr:PRC-barrel domain-containing protein [Longimicrobium sp.]
MASNDMDRVVPLGQLDDFTVADGEPDVRGWEVLASDGRKIGEVDELLVDTAAMKVRYLDVDVDDSMVAGGPDRHVLIPIGYARLERDRDCVMVDALASSDLARVPSYDQGPLTRDFETSVRESFSARRPTPSEGLMAGAGMMDTAGLDNTPGTGTALGMTGTTPGAGDLSGTGMRAADADSMHSTGSSAGMMASADDGMGGARMGAGSQGPAGGADREEMRGDAPRSAGLAGSDYPHGSDDFYASDAFDDARFYGSRRGGGSADAPGGGRNTSPNQATRGNMGLSAGTGGADQVDQLSGSGLRRDGGGGPDAMLAGESRVNQVNNAQAGPGGTTGTGDAGADRDETRRLARDARELLCEDQRNRDVPGGGTGNL